MSGLGGGGPSEKRAPLADAEEHCLHSRRSALPLSTFTSYLSVAFVTTLVYSRLHGTYLDDDQMAILQYREVVGCTSIWQLFDEAAALLRNDFWGVPLALNVSHKSWRPLTTLTFRAGWCLHGDFPFGFHIVNTVLHVVVTALFQRMCEKIVFHSGIVRQKSLRRSLAWVSAMLFGIHPIHVECVTNIVGRAEPLSAIFFILAIFASSVGRDVQGITRGGFIVGTWAGALSLVMCLLAVVSKEQGFSVVLVCAYLQTTVWSNVVPWVLRPLFGMSSSKTVAKSTSTTTFITLYRLGLLVVGSTLIALWRLSLNNGPVTVFTAADNGAAFAEHLSERLMTYAYYHWLQVVPLVWPSRLIHDLSFGTLKNVVSIWDFQNVASFGLYAALVLQGVYSLRVVCMRSTGEDGQQRKDDGGRSSYHEVVLSGFALLILPFIPASNLLQTVGFTVAERVMYLPSMGFCILFSLIFHSVSHAVLRDKSHAIVVDAAANAESSAKNQDSPQRCKRYVCQTILLGIMAGFGTRAYMRTADWDTELRLLDAGIWAYPSNPKLFTNMAIAVYAVNDDRARSVKAADWALHLKPDIHTAFTMRGLCYKDLGRLDQAEADFRKAISIAPNAEASARTNLGIVKVQQAQLIIDRVENLENNLGAAARGSRQQDRQRQQVVASDDKFSWAEKVALEELVAEALQFAGSNPSVLQAAADIYLKLGKPSLALVYLKAALRLRPSPQLESAVQVLTAQVVRA